MLVLDSVREVMTRWQKQHINYFTREWSGLTIGSRKLELIAHIQTKHECYVCEHNKYKVIKHCSLETHILSKHEGISYTCEHCKYKVNNQLSLKTHILSKHEGISYTCKHCKYKVINQLMLKTHIHTHFGTIPRNIDPTQNWHLVGCSSLSWNTGDRVDMPVNITVYDCLSCCHVMLSSHAVIYQVLMLITGTLMF